MSSPAPAKLIPLGTDQLGRDLWALTAAGYWRTLVVVAATCVTSLLIGLPLAGWRPDTGAAGLTP